MAFIAFDNGVTANGIGVVTTTGVGSLYKLPIKKELSYTKEAKHIHRINYAELVITLNEIALEVGDVTLVGLERPMVNSSRFNASLSAIRALEATLIALEELRLPYRYIDSKEWQKVMLPAGLKGGDQLKAGSLTVGKRLFPKLTLKKDADGLLIAEYLRRTHNK